MNYRYSTIRRGIRVFSLLLFFCLLAGSLLAQSPKITSFSPTVGTTGTTVSINGSGFTGVTAVTFGRVSTASFTVHSDTLITARVGNGASGLVAVYGPHGYDSLAGFVFVTLGTPHITSFSPDSGRTGTVVTINGTHFAGTTHVLFNGTAAASFTVESDTVIEATVGSGSSGLVQVLNPAGLASKGGFTYIATPVPTHITSFSPDSAAAGTTVRIHGVSFTGTTFVSFGGVSAQSFTVAADSLITAVVGGGPRGAVVVLGSSGRDSLSGFTYIATPVPTHITSFSPDSAAAGTTVRIHGVSFTGTTFVSFGGVSASTFTVVADTLLSAVVGTGASGAVVVSGARGTDSLSGFTYLVTDTPHIASFTPDSASAGTIVTISGTHFTGVSSVSFGGTPAASFTVISDSVLHARVGPGASGFVAVANANGSDSLAGFTYIPPVAPTHINYFTPTRATTGTTVFIHGVSFTGTTFVGFGGVSAQSFTVAADSLITAVVGGGASGAVVVSGVRGTDSLSGFTYLVTDTPHIASFTPDSASAGTIVTISGTHFTGVSSVSFGGTPAASFTVISDSVLHARVGPGASGFVAVANANGSDSLAGFTYIPPVAPTHINYFTPTRATTGTTVFIHGVSFTGTTFVGFGGVSAQSFTVAADSLITAVVGGGASGAVVVSGVRGADSLSGFTYLVTDTPHIASFTPDSASAGTIVTISGTHFTGVSSVSFGGTPAASFTVISDSVLHARVGPGASGFVAVANANGSDSLAGFTYIPPVAPTHINYFTPTRATTGTTVFIHGVSFTGTTFVGFGGVSAQSFTVAADSLITAVVGGGASGAVVVSGVRGADSLSGFTYLVTDTPHIASFTPDSASAGTI